MRIQYVGVTGTIANGVKMINIPQVIVNYPGGSGGEWLAIQIGRHEKYFHYHNGELESSTNNLNRWRMRGSWRSWILDQTDWKQHAWVGDTLAYTGKDEWWTEFWNHAPDTSIYYSQVQELINNGKRQFKIPVHRSHEGWYDQYWSDLFTEFKTVSISVDKNSSAALTQLQGNIIKKIFWQDLQGEDLRDELVDKCRKHKVDYHQVMTHLNRLPMPIKYTDMMLGIMIVEKQSLEQGIDAAFKHMASRWSDGNIFPYQKPIPGGHILDFKNFFVERRYSEYFKLCEYLEMEPLHENIWIEKLDAYADLDSNQIITTDILQERLWQTAAEMM